MLFKLHYWLIAAGANAVFILIGVFMETYTDGSKAEIGALLMMMPFSGIIMRPIICSLADRHQAHQKCLIYCSIVVILSYFPFIVIPLLGPQFYEYHRRLCWWLLVTLKVIGDIAFGGVLTVSDSLAVNYAKRIGAEYGTYRVWGTFSWMFFGFVTGQVNEVTFLPKYVPAFMILCASSAIDIFVCWLWPPEFFRMVAMKHETDDTPEDGLSQQQQREEQMTPTVVKKLMSDEDLRAHMKAKLKSLIPCWRSAVKVEAVELADVKLEPIMDHNGKLSTAAVPEQQIGQKTQLLLLAMIFRKDPRLIIYLAFFVCAGATLIPVSFFYMSLSEICNQQGTCNFSSLGGYLQMAMSGVEAILYMIIGRIITYTGRVNLCAASLALASFKYLFYGTVWIYLNPHWSILLELIHGVCVGCFESLTVELGHKFSNEVEFILPPMIEQGLIDKDVDLDKAKLSLSSTMLAVISAAIDGLGKGLGALVYGFLLVHYSYESLWLMIGIFAGLACLVALAISVFDRIFDPQLGLDTVANRKKQ